MSARVLLSGVLHKPASLRTSKAEKPYLMATVREGKGIRRAVVDGFCLQRSGNRSDRGPGCGRTDRRRGDLRGEPLGAGRARAARKLDHDRGRDFVGAKAQSRTRERGGACARREIEVCPF
jgi:hypothetical protein